MAWELTALVARRVCGGIVRKHLLTVLADRANPDGTGIWSSVRSLARDAECAERTVQANMRDFEREGLLHRVGRRACRHGWTVEYRLDVAALEALPSIDRAPPASAAAPKVRKHDEGASEEGATPAAAPPVQEMHPRASRTGAADAPVQEMRGTGAGDAPQRVQQLHPNLSREPIQEPSCSSESARMRDLIATWSQRLVAVSGPGLADPAREAGLALTVGELAAWARAGVDLELDAVPVIQARTAASRARPIRAWSFFRDAVLEAYARRTAALPLPTIRGAADAESRQTPASAAAERRARRLAVARALDLADGERARTA